MKESNQKLSARLNQIVEALPIKDGHRILEVGCGTGVVAREIVRRRPGISVLAIDRSSYAIDKAIQISADEIKSGHLSFRLANAENFALKKGEAPYDFAFAIRVGVLDGRHPNAETVAFHRIARALRHPCILYIDGGDPLRRLILKDYL